MPTNNRNSVNHVVALSGGKDSTAMLLMMLERRVPIHSVVFFDTGWEFPQMLEHVDALERRTGIDIVRLRPEVPFEELMLRVPVVARRGERKGEVTRIGRGWPAAMRRWCTGLKARALDRYVADIPDVTACIGFAADEAHRAAGPTMSRKPYRRRYPLIEWNVTEDEALRYCRRQGYDWGGVYDVFRRVSCYCCPLQRIGELRKLRQHFPNLWQHMLDLDGQITNNNRGYKWFESLRALDRRFESETPVATVSHQSK